VPASRRDGPFPETRDKTSTYLDATADCNGLPPAIANSFLRQIRVFSREKLDKTIQ
jgi:hypothetical protein